MVILLLILFVIIITFTDAHSQQYVNRVLNLEKTFTNFENVEHPIKSGVTAIPDDYLITNLPGLEQGYETNMYSGQLPVYEDT